MIGKCDRCGLENVEVMSIKKQNSQEQITLCNQCRPADGAYEY
jgi:transcription elongation factor Elf1